MFKGIYAALLTPFTQQKINIEQFAGHIEKLIYQGINGLVPCGTTGEAPTLTLEERTLLIKTCCEVTNQRLPVMAGVGTSSTTETVALAQKAEKLGVNALLVVSPYYNKPTQEGIFVHYKTIHDHTNTPIFLYSNPSRCGMEITIETIARLGELPRIKGLKDATMDLGRCLRIRRLLGEEFVQFTGEDSSSGAYLAAGGHGCISVTANIAASLYSQLYQAWLTQNIIEFQHKQAQLSTLNNLLFCQTNPIPLKYAASILGICSNELRLPLMPLDSIYHQPLQQCLQILGKQQ